jgi:hypothetical protein
MKSCYGNDCPLLPIGPWRGWVEDQLSRMSTNDLAERLGVDQRVLFRWRVENTQIRLDKVDAALCRFGDPNLLNELYPVPDDERIAA